jgi:hypothetical protein
VAGKDRPQVNLPSQEIPHQLSMFLIASKGMRTGTPPESIGHLVWRIQYGQVCSKAT